MSKISIESKNAFNKTITLFKDPLYFKAIGKASNNCLLEKASLSYIPSLSPNKGRTVSLTLLVSVTLNYSKQNHTFYIILGSL